MNAIVHRANAGDGGSSVRPGVCFTADLSQLRLEAKTQAESAVHGHLREQNWMDEEKIASQ
jgi:hypothetical protein